MPSGENESLGEAVKPSGESPPKKKSKKSKRKSSTSSNNKDVTANEPVDSNPIIRDSASRSINPRNILAGYGATGKRTRHTVHDGALQMPRESWNVIKEATLETGMEAASKYKLPAIDSVVRPSMDPKVTQLHVTRMEIEKVEVVQQPQVDPAMLAYLQQAGQPLPQAKIVKVLQSKFRNLVIHRVPKKVEASTGAEAERIRGGGGEGEEEGVQDSGNTGGDEDPPTAVAPTDQPSAETQPVDAQLSAETQPSQEETTAGADSETATPSAPEPSPATAEPVTNTEAAATNSEEAPPAQPPAATSEVEDATEKPSEEEPVPMDVDSPEKTSDQPVVAEPTDTNPDSTAVETTHSEQKDEAAAPAPGETEEATTTGDAEPPKEDTPVSAEAEQKEEESATKEPATSEMDAGAAQEVTETVGEEAPKEDTPATTEADQVEDSAKQDASSETDPAVAATTEETQATMETDQREESAKEPAASETDPTVATTTDETETPSAQPSATEQPQTTDTAEETKDSDTTAPAETEGSETTPKEDDSSPTEAPTDAEASADKVSSANERPKGGKNLVKMEESKKEEEAKKEEKKETPAAQSLQSKPEPEWEQHKPSAHDETVTPPDQLPKRPEWYNKDSISDVERAMLPEWFDSSSPHRTPESYMEAREKAVKMSDTLANRNVTSAMIRRSIVGDAGSLLRLRDFLVHWGVINEDAINDSAPTPASLRPDLKRPKDFSEDMRSDLISAVVQQAKRRKVGTDADGDHDMGVETTTSSLIPINWDEVADKVGHGASAEECQKNFMMESLQSEPSASSAERPITPEATNDASKPAAVESTSSVDKAAGQTKEEIEKELMESLVKEADPQVMGAVFGAAMKATDGNLAESQAATRLGLHLSRSVEEARSHEVDLADRLSKLVDMRMKKLENRMGMMDDVESILEAEKVAIELERRDLYTARCRHWFGGA